VRPREVPLWRSLKYEDIYLKGYSDGHEAKAGVARWIEFYNFQRPHQALENRARWRSGGPVSPAHSANRLWI
jgi:transposase InsO family protein